MTFEGWNWLPWALIAALIFFGLGWFVARIDLRELLSESRALPQSYFKGLNFLLNEQQDKAIEAFLVVTQANTETVELQFALGSLFRRRGEIERAIRLHQSLSERGDLSADQRIQAQLGLAQDYQKAGLLDRAEQILADIARLAKGGGVSPPAHTQALQLLLDVYIQERNWPKAIAAATQLETVGKRAYRKEIAHFFCEQAIDEYDQGQQSAAQALLDQALATNPHCVRANMIRGEWLALVGEHRQAIAAWREIETQDSAYLGLSADAMLASYQALGQESEGLQELSALQRQYPTLDFLNAIFQTTLKNEGADAAYNLVRDDLKRNPTLVGIDRLLDARISGSTVDRIEDLQLVKSVVHAHASRLAVYLCSHCGFKARQFYWHCPACGGWETFPPRRTAEYDTADRHLARLHIEG